MEQIKEETLVEWENWKSNEDAIIMENKKPKRVKENFDRIKQLLKEGKTALYDNVKIQRVFETDDGYFLVTTYGHKQTYQTKEAYIVVEPIKGIFD